MVDYLAFFDDQHGNSTMGPPPLRFWHGATRGLNPALLVPILCREPLPVEGHRGFTALHNASLYLKRTSIRPAAYAQLVRLPNTQTTLCATRVGKAPGAQLSPKKWRHHFPFLSLTYTLPSPLPIPSLPSSYVTKCEQIATFVTLKSGGTVHPSLESVLGVRVPLVLPLKLRLWKTRRGTRTMRPGHDTIRYDTIRDAILTCARKPT